MLYENIIYMLTSHIIYANVAYGPMNKSIYSRMYKHMVGRLKSARRSVGYTQVEAGRKLGKDQTFVSKVESGQYRLDLIQLYYFAKLYKRDIKYFIGK